MHELIIPVVTGVASFIGSYAALKVHVDYLRRDVDLAHRRIDTILDIKKAAQ